MRKDLGEEIRKERRDGGCKGGRDGRMYCGKEGRISIDTKGLGDKRRRRGHEEGQK